MRMKYIFSLLLLFLNLCIAFPQKKQKEPVLSDSLVSNVYCEKVYIHTDRSFYFADDDLWFKAYLVDAFTNNLVNNSNILYVELISSDSKIVQKKTVQLSDGTGNGDFHIGNEIMPGQYELRAYTNWMRNFSDEFFFKKIIYLESAANENSSEKRILKPESKTDIQFFPEGGSLVDNVQSLVGFKALDSNGYGCDVAGSIISSEGDTVTKFESTHLGMGRFYFTPLKGSTYFAAGRTKAGLEFNTKLPASSADGIVLRTGSVENGRLFLNVTTNQQTLPAIQNKTFKLEIRAHKLFYLSAALKISSLRNSFSIPVKEVPEGIAILTVSDDEGKPLCERLAYFHNQSGLNVSLIPDNTEYSRRSPVSLNFSVTDTLGKPVLSSISLSVTDAEVGKNIDIYQSDIASYFLLESEIKGRIEQPGYYFDPLNNDRLKDLDLLLLTQGWRDFKWKYIPDSTRIDYPVEFGFPISGRLTRQLVNIPLPSANISLVLMTGNGYFYSAAKTNSSGNFSFANLRFPGKVTMVISATDERNRPNGFIHLDSIIKTSPKIDYSYIPVRETMPEEVAVLKNEAIKIDLIKKKYSLKDTIELTEVVVSAKKSEVKENSVPQIYSNPDYVFKTDNKTPFFSNIFTMMQGQLPGVTISGSPPNISVSIRGAGAPLFLLDGTPVDMDIIAGVSVSEVDRIDVLKTANTLAEFGIRGGNGVISVITKRGTTGERYVPVPYSINKTIYGYDVPRKFYSPKYDKPDSTAQNPDLRTTIFWDPNIFTGSDSTSRIKYYNGDKATKVIIRAEGMTRNGIPITAKAGYLVR